MSMYILENNALRICVSDSGAELCSVMDKSSGAERIWIGDPNVWNRHAPILFPFVGRVTGGKYRIGEQEYEMKTQHGFARDMQFACVEKGELAIVQELQATDATRAIYPYEFKLTVRHSLDPENSRRLRIDWRVENRGEECMYYSIGGHPGFLLPGGERKEDTWLVFPGREALIYFGADAAGFALPNKKKTLELDEGYVKYQSDIPDTWIFEDQKIETVQIARSDRSPYITMHCEQFPILAIWANAKGPFICLEPWFGRTDDAGFEGTLAEKKGMEHLPAGGSREISYSIEFHQI